MSETLLSPERLKERIAAILQLLAWREITTSGARAQIISLLPWKSRAHLSPVLREEMLGRLITVEAGRLDVAQSAEDIAVMIVEVLEAQKRLPTRNVLGLFLNASAG